MALQQPTNTNNLVSNRYVLSFLRLPNTQFFCQTVNLPGINLSQVPRATPFVDIQMPGEKLIYDPLSVTFLVDEDLTAWREIHDWMRGLGFPTGFDEYKNLNKQSKFISNPRAAQYSDATLIILDSNQLGQWRFKIRDMFPTSLAPFTMSATLGPETILTADVTLAFTYFDIEKI